MNRPFTATENARRRDIQRATGLTHRQLELLVAVVAWERVERGPASLRQLGRRLTAVAELSLVTPTQSDPNGHQPPYAGALLRLVRLGLVSYARGEVASTALGREYLDALKAGRPRPKERLLHLVGGK